MLQNATRGVFDQKRFRYREPRKNLLEGDPQLTEEDRSLIVARAKAQSNHHHLLQIGKMVLALAAVIGLLAIILQ